METEPLGLELKPKPLSARMHTLWYHKHSCYFRALLKQKEVTGGMGGINQFPLQK